MTATVSPTPTPSVCPFTFADDTKSTGTACGFIGPANADPLCPSDLEAFVSSDGTYVGVAIGVLIDNKPDLVLFGATKVSATEAALVSYMYGQGTESIPVTGTIQLTQGGRMLILTPDSPLGSDQCSFSQYSGTFVAVVGG